ncbi:MAG: hypothetical protein ACE5KG_06655 [Nitrososphaerales archaeon]
MSVPTELAWLVPIAVPLLIGLFVGSICRRSIKILFPIVDLVIVLVATGYITLSFQDVFDRAMDLLPRLLNTGQGFVDSLPYTSASFLIGLALGLWKG